jgi:CheY-like chemotaxis protein
MKTEYSETESLSSWRLPEGETRVLPVAVGKTGKPVGWIERTLLAVNTDRVFIEVSDPELREELVTAYEDEGCDVIAASNSKTLLAFMEQLPIPHDFGNDLVLAEDDFPGTNATDLHRHLLEHGWSIPVFTVSTQSPPESADLAS